jgi:acyl-CoA reductase-like NAD-dependent aldehyde dehydrogenase
VPSQSRSTRLPGAVLGQWAEAGAAEARAAIAAARRAFETTPWSRDRSLRHRALSEMADRFDAHAEELGTLVTKENGKKIAEGLLEGAFPGPTLRHTAAQALTDTGISAEVAPGQWFSTYAEPAGVVGIIVPWTNTWAAINDGFAEGGYKQSGIGRLRGPLAITEFQEAKTVVHSIPPAQA